MGRKSKLTEKQWDEIRKRLLAGEKASPLAREYGVAPSNISDRFSERLVEIRNIANRVVAAEIAMKSVATEVEAMPFSEKMVVLALAEDMRAISTDLSGAARHGAATAHRLAAIANKQVAKIDDENPMESQEVLQGISALTKMSNEAAKTGIDLIIANKKDPLPDPNADEKRFREILNFKNLSDSELDVMHKMMIKSTALSKSSG
jgi:hypothetical protein